MPLPLQEELVQRYAAYCDVATTIALRAMSVATAVDRRSLSEKLLAMTIKANIAEKSWLAERNLRRSSANLEHALHVARQNRLLIEMGGHIVVEEDDVNEEEDDVNEEESDVNEDPFFSDDGSDSELSG